jgi:hypothetical protein
MFTLTRLIAAILLAVFALWLAGAYDALYDAERPLMFLPQLLAGSGFAVGWAFLGKKSKALWMSAYLGVQAVVLTGVVAASLVAVRDIFELGYRRRFSDAGDAVMAIPMIAWDYLSRALVTDFLIVLGVGGVVLGVAVHAIDRMLDRRRLAR